MKTNTRSPLILVVYTVLSTVVLLSLTACGGGGNPPVSDQAYAVAIQNDGKIVVAGDSYNGGNYQWSVALARYNGNGSLDSSFGSGGKVLTSIGAGARAIAIQQSDGKIVAVGSSYDTPYNFVVMRYNGDGSLDLSFGSRGVVLTNLGGGYVAGATSLAIQSGGNIVAAGYSYNSISGYDFAVARYTSDGTPDTGFGGGSGAVFDLGGGASSVAIQADGKILAAGGSYLIRYNIDGSLDSLFGFGSGIVYSGSPDQRISGVALQADGQILSVGSAFNGISSGDLVLTRYNSADGSIDTSFGTGGWIVTPAMGLYNLTSASVVVNQTTGKIVVAGFTQDQFFVLARYNSDGTPDTNFNSSGKLLTTGGSYWNSNSFVQASAVQADGRIVLAGSSYKDDSNGYDFALARLASDGGIDTAFGTNGRVTTGF